jgi:hypothetical protein
MSHRHGLAGVSVIALAFCYLIYRGLEMLCLSCFCRGALVRWLLTGLAAQTIIAIFAILSSRGIAGVEMLVFPHSRQKHCLVHDQIKALWRF